MPGDNGCFLGKVSRLPLRALSEEGKQAVADGISCFSQKREIINSEVSECSGTNVLLLISLAFG